jgi:dipeptidyl aminopeptidase/acylaminoacyl peptidase
MHPPQAIADLIEARQSPMVSLSPDRRWLLLAEPQGLPPITQLAQGELRLAGLRINPRANARSRASYFRSLTLLEIASRCEAHVSGLPDHARIGHVCWAPDGRHIAFMLVEEDHCELWLAERESGEARRWSELRLNAAGGCPLGWHPDNQSVFCEVVPAQRGPVPPPPLEIEPIVHDNAGRPSPARTFQDLLKNAHDAALFEHYLTSQLVRIDLNGRVTPLGTPRVFAGFDPSPDGNHLLVETIERPYSYLVPAFRFPRRIEVWDMQGRVAYAAAELPLAEDVPVTIDAVRKGPRSFGWRSDAPATLLWAVAQDGGDPDIDVNVRDKLFALAAPFDSSPVTLAELGFRFHEVAWCDADLTLVREGWWKTRRERLWWLGSSDPARPPELLFDRSTEDRYTDPGRPLLRRAPDGHRIIVKSADRESIFLVGKGAASEGSRPFVDRFHLPTRTATRLWHSQPPWYETPLTFLDEEQELLLVGRETVEEPTNYYVQRVVWSGHSVTHSGHGVTGPQGGDESPHSKITSFPHPTPQLRNAQKEVLRYQRPDGVTCTATLYLPPGYRASEGPLPALFWVYPQEYKSAEAASQMTRSPHRFIQVSPHSPLLWLTQGYAVVDGPTMPIVGEGDAQPNDTYIAQLVASAAAAVDEVVRRGVVDRGRVAIGGHSYGGFTVANLLAHSDLFRAGIALSGAYNRTLTPFGFQSEERTLWQAPQTYLQMSPFLHADKIRAPFLLIHGNADENPGTYPLQSERLYQALKGLGATVRLVLLPHEGHVYHARESLLRVAAEITHWLEKHVKAVDAPSQRCGPVTP